MASSVVVFPPGFRVTDANDQPLSGAVISFFGAGTTTPKTVYSDYNLTVAIGTSITTDAGGYPSSGGNKVLVYVDTAPYKVTIADSLGNVIASHDNVLGAITAGSGGGTVTSATATYGMGVGDVKLSLRATPDAGFVRLTDTVQALAKASYPDLNSWASGQSYPWGSSSTTFNVPAAGGYFLRFAASGNTVDPSGPRAPGSTQADDYKSHTHTANVSDPGHTHPTNTGGGSGTAQSGSGFGGATSASGSTNGAFAGITVSIVANGGTETRGKNVAMYADMMAVPALVANGLIGAAGLAYQFNSTTSPASLLIGQFCFDASPGSATKLHISETDYNGSALAAFIQAFPSGTRFLITKVGAPGSSFILTSSSAATDNGTYDTFNLSAVGLNGTISNSDLCNITPIISGTAGASGTNGINAGYTYSFETSTTMAAPGTGGIRFNSATAASITAVAISNSTADSGNPSIATSIDTWDDSTSPTDRGRLIVKKIGAPQVFVELRITGGNTGLTGANQIAVAYVAGPAGFSAADGLSVQFVATGPAGAGNVSATSSFPADNQVMRTDGTGTNVQGSALTLDDTGNLSGLRYVELEAVSVPSAPASGKLRFYNKVSTKKLYQIDDTGTETDLTATGGGGGGGGNAAYINNLTLVSSVTSNALTIAVKTAAGADPAGDITVAFRSATEASGGYDTLSLSGALSLVISSGSTMGFTNATAGSIWVVLFNDAGTPRLGVINCLNGTSIYPLAAHGIASSTAEGGAGAADNAQTFYTGSAVTSKSYVVLGRLEWSSGLTTAGTWNAVPTRTKLFGPDLRLPGDPFNKQATETGALATGTTTIPYDDTIPQSTEGDQYMSQAITPSSAANLLEIEIVFLGHNASAGYLLIAALFQDSVANALASAFYPLASSGGSAMIAFRHLMRAGTQAATTFKLRAGVMTGGGSTTTTFNGSSSARAFGGTMASSIKVREIQA